jgi:hypothetical protein
MGRTSLMVLFVIILGRKSYWISEIRARFRKGETRLGISREKESGIREKKSRISKEAWGGKKEERKPKGVISIDRKARALEDCQFWINFFGG